MPRKRRVATGSGYPIAAEAFDQEVLQLASVFAGSRELARYAAKYPAIQQLRSVFELSEAARRLIAVAALVRSALDTWSAYQQAELDVNVGRLIPDVTRPRRSVVLTFREACNKLIHADEIELLDETKPPGCLSYDVTAYGERGDQQWRAHLKVLPFVEAAAHVV